MSRHKYMGEIGTPKDDAPMTPLKSVSMVAPASDTQQFDYMFKILIIGNSSVGKTSFLFRYADNNFTSSFVSTVGIDFKVKTIVKQNKKIKLQIWDTAGQERYRTITTAYYRGAMGFLLMYDVTSDDSFNAVQDWVKTLTKTLNHIHMHPGNRQPLSCLANAQGLSSRTKVVQHHDFPFGLEFFETSAKDNTNVKAAIERLVDLICDKMSESVESDPTMVSSTAKSTRLTEHPQKDKCAC